MAFPRRWSDPELLRTGRWLLWSALVGIVSGIGAILFDLLFRLSSIVLLRGIGGYGPPTPRGETVLAAFGPSAPWRLVVAVVLGGLLSGMIVFRYAPEAEGHGTDGVLKAFHRGLGKIRRRVPLVKLIASSITIGSGGSAGREGPIAQIGAGFGSFLGDILHLTNRERRLLMLAGVAGGVGAIFRAPFGAALFCAEVLYREPEFEYEALMPGLLSSIVGYSIYASYAGWDPMFHTPGSRFTHPVELLGYALLGLLCAVVAILYVEVFWKARDLLFRRLPIARMWQPAAGALLLGLLATGMPEALGMGYGIVQEAIDGQLAIGWMLLFVLAKIVATSCTISSGGSGGVFAPSLVIGGVLGGAFGQTAHQLLPEIFARPSAYVMVGMGAFFAGAAKVPFASVVMVMEMTGSYGLMVPTLLAASIAYLLTPRRFSLYENQVQARIDSPAHLGSFAVDILERIRVRDAIPADRAIRTLREDLPLREFLERLRHENPGPQPIVDREGRLAGLLTYDGIRRAAVGDALQGGETIGQVAQRKVRAVGPDDDLREVLQAFLTNASDTAPVVDPPRSGIVVGTITREDVLLAYDREMLRLRSS